MKNMSLFLSAVIAMTVLASAPAVARPKKTSSAEAKKECLTENPNLSGKELRRCMKEKRKKK